LVDLLKILAIDTSGASVSVAALDGERVKFEVFEQSGLNHSRRLMVWIERALDAVGWTMRDIERVAVVVGPGSFTGVRIGVATARAFGQTGIPCVGVNALEALAADAGSSGLICPVLDARAGQVYAAAFWGGDPPVRVLADTACSLEALLCGADTPFNKIIGSDGKPPSPILFTGDGAERLWDNIKDRLGERAERTPPNRRLPRASVVGRMALFADVGRGSGISGAAPYSELVPLYLRAPQAERERHAREAALPASLPSAGAETLSNE
jgi:tRNA threonylcarbamoyladenosine biosynthesis protein TsaB